MVRVLNVFGSLNRGGSETMAMNYYRNINRSDIQFDFVVHTEEEGAYEKEIRELGGRIFRIRRFKGFNIFSYIKDWRKLLLEHPECSIVHCHFYTIAGYIFAFACRNCKKRIAHSHNADAKFSTTQRIAFKINKRLVKMFATDFIACGNDAGLFLYNDTPFTVIANAIDVNKFVFSEDIRRKKKKELGFENNFIVGHIGRFSKQKNHMFLIDIFAEIYRQNNNARLLLIGIGPLEANIKRKVSDLGLSKYVVFTGERSDVPELMMAMDVFILPSIHEGLALVGVEAQASGLFSIFSDQVTSEMNVTHLASNISLQQSPSDWADAILKYSIEYKRENMFQIIKDAGYDVVSNVKVLENLYLS